MKVTPLMHFVHGAYALTRGQAVELPDGIAADLLRASLVETTELKAQNAAANKAIGPSANKRK